MGKLKIYRVDATEFNKNVGDFIKKGEFLGYFKNKKVIANENGYICGISFDAENHCLNIIIEIR
ncbi:hypothetical protein J422_06199 [Methanocaldococcus villosus KIN24-T80]|uniref:Uncharacterized protein n=1 Tax=Methanocaldococcus villosus KIN24-T80 TaxID=1069083 RepID=N6V086_9EURY|nr:hypothetical protein [Methanocaldococcus villosus]ENN95723.1 hypothetical protein J422_06199 [Methanocaldococcus villosus KIN24-T80]